MTPQTCVASGRIRRGFPLTVATTGPDCFPGFFSTWMSLGASTCAARFKETRNITDARLDRRMYKVKQIIAWWRNQRLQSLTLPCGDLVLQQQDGSAVALRSALRLGVIQYRI